MMCRHCKSENVSVNTNAMIVSQDRSFLWNLLMVFLTSGLWILWMFVRGRKERKVIETWATCQNCGNRWKI